MEQEKERLIVSIIVNAHDTLYELLMDDDWKADYEELSKDELTLREWLDDKAKQGFSVDGLYKHSEKVARIKEKFPSLNITISVPRNVF